jgi:hypothetical protein
VEQYTLTLDAPAGDLEPSGTTAVGNITSKAMSVLVKSEKTGLPKYLAKVRITLGVIDGTGGHDHPDLNRPKGTLAGCAAVANLPNNYDCTTGAVGTDGKATFTFTSTQVSGTHTVSASCISPVCINSQSVVQDVKVAGLSQIPASPLYALTEADGSVIGARPDWHTDNHNMTSAAADALWRLAARYRFENKFQQGAGATPRNLYLNDASLPWGGVYDICARTGACGSATAWQPPHHEHRRGTVVDVRANRATGAIPSGDIKLLFKRMLDEEARKSGISFLHESPGTTNEHFHIRLLGRGE